METVEMPVAVLADLKTLNELRIYIALLFAHKNGLTPRRHEIIKALGMQNDGYSSYYWKKLYNSGWISFDEKKRPIPLLQSLGKEMRVPYSTWQYKRFGLE